MKRTSGIFRLACLIVVGALMGWASPAKAQDAAVLSKVTDLNRRALDAYENLDIEESRKFLMEALQLCASAGLNSHALKARTHVHLGVVLVGGLKRRDLGLAQFKRALEIDPNIKVTKRLNNPEVQAAFEEASGKGTTSAAPATAVQDAEKPAATPPRAEPAVAETAPAKAEKAETPAEKPEVAEAPAPVAPAPVAPVKAAADERAPKKITGVFHQPVTETKADAAIEIKAAVESALPFDRVVLAYRPEGAADFLARDMAKNDLGWWTARIPQPATRGNMVSYYIEARNKAGQAIAANGSAGEPHLVTLASAEAIAADVAAGANAASAEKAGSDSEDPRPAKAGASAYWAAFSLGTGFGYASGTPEVTRTNGKGMPLSFGGTAPASLLHLSPEIGYFYDSKIILSLQARLQFVSGASDVYSPGCAANQDSKGVGICPPAKYAFAILGKATYRLAPAGALRPFLTGSVGAGSIRHLVSLGHEADDCGPTRDQICKDTVNGGILLLGPGAGFTYPLTDSLSAIAGVNLLVGVPKATVNIDVNLGLGLAL